MKNPIHKLSSWYFSKGALPYWCILILDCAMMMFAGYIAFYLQGGGNYFAAHFWPMTRGCILCTFIYSIFFRQFHTYSGIMRYTSFHEMLRILFATTSGSLVILAMVVLLRNCHIGFMDSVEFPNIKYGIIAFALGTLFLMITRMVVRSAYDGYRTASKTKKVFIYGVKEGGIGLARSLSESPTRTFRLTGFVNPDEFFDAEWLMGVKVFHDDKRVIHEMKERGATVMIVSPLQSEHFTQRTELVDALTEAGIKILMMPVAEEWDGKTDISHYQLKEVEIEDLLPRQKIEVDMNAIGEMLKGKRILITGAAGSIGSEMARQVAKFHPSELILVDQAETPMHDVRLWMNNFLKDASSSSSLSSSLPKVYTIVGSITNKEQMEKIFSEHQPEYVFHAAAYKHVPMMEDNPAMAVQNNIYGTRVIADLAVKYGTKKFVMISTDKAVNPTNVMGCSKRICEIYCQSLNQALEASSQPSPKGEGVEEPLPTPLLKERENKKDLGIHTADPAWYSILKNFAEENRKNPTEAESLLWNAIRNNGIGYKFRQQHIIQDFIVDFFCNDKKLTIELDGGYHNTPAQMVSDEQRTARLKELGYTELRFTNEEVIGNLESVLETIKNQCAQLPSLQERIEEGALKSFLKTDNALKKSFPSGEDLGEAFTPSPLGEGRGEASREASCEASTPSPLGEGRGEASHCEFITTRFGNVLGSNGSVIPIFKEQIKNGGPVKVTHPDIIRYFMLIPEACRLVLQAGTMGHGGEIFIFDMGEPVKIVDLAKRMIKLSGAKDIDIIFTGLRDGEKLYEELLATKENTKPTTHPKIMVAQVREYPYDLALKNEKELYDLSFTFDDMEIVKKMKSIVPEYKSQVSKYEVLDK